MSRSKKPLNQIEEEVIRGVGLGEVGIRFGTRATIAMRCSKRGQRQLLPSDFDIPFGGFKFQAHNFPFLTYATQ